MFRGFFGKKDQTAAGASKDALDSRGLEVIDDDPETVWSMWDSAMAQQDAQSMPPLPALQTDFQVPVEPAHEPQAQKSAAARKEDALAVVELHHHRIAQTIRVVWGDRECSSYINKLIMNGGDGLGRNRIGFSQEAVQAMMVLAELHEKEFGPAHSDSNGFSPHSTWDGVL